jgi:L-aspartate oxidase
MFSTLSRKLAGHGVAGKGERPVVVVGGGVAGMTAALAAAVEAPVVLIAKGPPERSTSSWAQGGIAAAIGPGDDPELHVDDTLRAGRGLCREAAVRTLAVEAAARIRDLVDLGVAFDEGLGLEGGHSAPRIVHAGGAATGAHVARALAARVAASPHIEVRSGVRVLGLWTAGDECLGVITGDGPVGARATLLATGGAAGLWARTTNPPGANGEGIAMAYRAGAAVADLELVQFHPTALPDTGVLLSEALRGAGALLVDGEGHRFVDELAPRDVVARAIDAHGGTALLDLRPVDRGRFPTLVATLERSGYDPAAAPVPVAPAAHYTMGGVVTDLDGRAEIRRLYAAGECACPGVHGANRLASNSLLECLVFGRRAGIAAVAEPGLPRRLPSPSPPEPEAPVTPALRAELWREAGLVRDAAGLEALRRAGHPLARLVAEGALAREESRGAHFRADYPAESEALRGHFVHRRGEPARLERWA